MSEASEQAFEQVIAVFNAEEGEYHLNDEDEQRRTFTKKQVEVLWLRQGGVCYGCNRGMDRESDQLHAHHVQPYAEGGATIVDNGVLLHARCHQIYHRMLPFFHHCERKKEELSPFWNQIDRIERAIKWLEAKGFPCTFQCDRHLRTQYQAGEWRWEETIREG